MPPAKAACEIPTSLAADEKFSHGGADRVVLENQRSEKLGLQMIDALISAFSAVFLAEAVRTAVG